MGLEAKADRRSLAFDADPQEIAAVCDRLDAELAAWRRRIRTLYPEKPMPIIARDTRREFNPAPEGLHQAVCIDVVDLGKVKTQWGEKHKVEIRWQLEVLDDATGLPFMVLRRYTPSLNEKATLRAHLEAWRGRKFTREELDSFDLEKLLGVNCQIQVVHDLADDGRVWANVSAVVPLGKGMVKLVPSDTYVRVVNRQQTNGAPTPAADEVPF